VGSAAIQVASRLGAMVTAVTRDESHREYLGNLGAEHVIIDAGDRSGSSRFAPYFKGD
jgi:NADPH:quinone reductase-like Zn-dependent oxidoreductase